MAVNERALLSLGALLVLAQRQGQDRPFSAVTEKIRRLQAEDPTAAIGVTVLASAAAFYAVERGKNPKVRSFYDALVYVSTNLSVGFSDIFAQTPLGKVLGSALMTWGPALATRALDPPAPPASEVAAPDTATREVVQRLDAILHELRARGT